MNLPEPEIDIAIITITRLEYEAMLSHIENPSRDPGSHREPNRFAWQVGTISGEGRSASYRVVLALAGKPTNVSSALATLETVQRWKPRYTLLVGIAGGLPREGLVKGDVVISSVIWAYEYGKHTAGFHPRHDFTYPVDGALLRTASTVSNRWRENIRVQPPEAGQSPKVLTGPIASGEKVIDSITNEFFEAVLKAWPKLQAVEMEGAGAASAIAEIHERGWPSGFLMIRGISDMPSSAGTDAQATQQTIQRDTWTRYAAETAATFTAYWIRTAWPVPALDQDPR